MHFFSEVKENAYSVLVIFFITSSYDNFNKSFSRTSLFLQQNKFILHLKFKF